MISKKIAFGLCCFLILIGNDTFSNNTNQIYKMNNIYMIIAAISAEIDDQSPTTKICKLSFDNNRKATFKLVREINAFHTQKVEIFHDYDLAIISTSVDEIWSAYVDSYFINLNEPWNEVSAYRHLDVDETLYPAEILGKNKIISYSYGKTPTIKVIDPDTLKETRLTPAGITKFPERNTEFTVCPDGKLKYEKWGMEDYYYPLLLPKQFNKSQSVLVLIEETKKYVIFEMNYNTILIYDKRKNTWVTYSLKSYRADYKIIDNILIARCLKKSTEAHRPDQYTWEYVLINLESQKIRNFYLPGEIILFATNSFMLTVDDYKLIHYALYSTGKAQRTVICEDYDVSFITEVFLGPEKIPDGFER